MNLTVGPNFAGLPKLLTTFTPMYTHRAQRTIRKTAPHRTGLYAFRLDTQYCSSETRSNTQRKN